MPRPPSRWSRASGTAVTHRYETTGRGLHYEAVEVARCLEAGEVESPLMPLDESVEIMETMERVLETGRDSRRVTTQ